MKLSDLLERFFTLDDEDGPNKFYRRIEDDCVLMTVDDGGAIVSLTYAQFIQDDDDEYDGDCWLVFQSDADRDAPINSKTLDLEVDVKVYKRIEG